MLLPLALRKVVFFENDSHFWRIPCSDRHVMLTDLNISFFVFVQVQVVRFSPVALSFTHFWKGNAIYQFESLIPAACPSCGREKARAHARVHTLAGVPVAGAEVDVNVVANFKIQIKREAARDAEEHPAPRVEGVQRRKRL